MIIFDKNDVLLIVRALGELKATLPEKAVLIPAVMEKLEETLPPDHKLLQSLLQLSADPENYNRDFCDPFFLVQEIDHDWKMWKIRGAVGRLSTVSDVVPTVQTEAAAGPAAEQTLAELVASVKSEFALDEGLTVMAAITEAESQLLIDAPANGLKERAKSILAML